MERCKMCNQTISLAKDTPCKKCNGSKIYENKACKRCNGTGLEIINLARRNRSRGNSTENAFAKILKKWWDPINPAAQFTRTPGSGGSHMKDGWNFRGDITTNDPSFPFYIESKKEKSWSFEQLMTAKNGGRIGEYVQQVREEWKEDSGKLPILRISHPGPGQQTFIGFICFAVPSSSANVALLNFVRETTRYVEKFTMGSNGLIHELHADGFSATLYFVSLDNFLSIPPKEIIEVVNV